MTIEQLLEEQLSLIDSWKSSFTPLYRAVLDIRGQMSKRIFGTGTNNGSNSVGQELPTKPYSTQEIYVDPRSLKRVPSGKNIGKRGKPIKSLYFEGGYSELKTLIGRPALELTNNLDSSFTNTPIVNSGENAAIVVDDSEAGKVAGLENKYGKIFDMTDEEDALFGELLAEYITEALNG
jgi:hypothetical protein